MVEESVSKSFQYAALLNYLDLLRLCILKSVKQTNLFKTFFKQFLSHFAFGQLE